MTLLRLLAGAALVLPCLAQNTPDLARILSFETEHPNGFPGGWGGGPRETISVDDKVVHGGKWSVRLRRKEGESGDFSTITKGFPVDFTGSTLVLRGFLRTEDVTGFAGLFSLPGGLSTMISGLGVFYPDKKPTQRVGIVPDIEVKPTITGIRAGRDELVEEAVRQILGGAH
jgi:hypothetical protein